MKVLSILFAVPAAILLTACEKPPQASFTIDPANCSAGDTVFFNNTTVDASTYEWDFGDDAISAEENPFHIYRTGGYYTVTLTATNNKGSDDASEFVNVKEETGTLLQLTIHSESLENNLLNDTPDRAVSVYLPPEYDRDNQERFPVLYLLHAWISDNDSWFGTSIGNVYNGLDVSKLMDQRIKEGSLSPMIIVAPNANNSYDGCWYTNSSVSGNWEDFIVKDLVDYTDNHYRTLQKAESRGIAGHSMGGYGAISIALKHPDVFGAVYSMSAGDLVFDDMPEVFKDGFITAALADNYNDQPIDVQLVISMAVAFAPHVGSSPFPANLPVDRDGNLIDSIWKTWLIHDPVLFLSDYAKDSARLMAIQFDCGLSDIALPFSIDFSDRLTEMGIDHIFESYEGNHTSEIKERMNTKVLPFFSKKLNTE
jgi:S-formylglutathione hydrolase